MTIRASWCAVLALSGLLAAQGGTRAITVQNLSAAERDEWVVAVVPFAAGEVRESPALHVAAAPTVWQPLGARWNDGSLRQALCMFRAHVPARGTVQLPLEAGEGQAPVGGFVPLPEHTVRFVATIGGERFEGEPVNVATLEDNAARRVILARGRIGTSGLVAETTLEWYRGQTHAWFGLGVFFSDPARTDLVLDIDELAVETRGMALFVRHPGPLGVEGGTNDVGSRTVLLRKSHFADGQGLRRNGVLVPPLDDGDSPEVRLRNATWNAATEARPLAATSWVESGAFGAFGFVPPPPPWLANQAALAGGLARKHADYLRWSRTVAGDPFRSPKYGPAASAHQAGEQADFGIVALEPVAFSGIPSFLFEVEWSVLQEGCRPVHFFEADASPLQASAHPDWVAHNGRSHQHVPTSPDRLGKTDPKARYDAHRWFGKDNQHWSSNYLGAYYLLTGDPQLRLEIENEVQLFLASQTLREGIWTSTPGVSRAAGRTMLAGTWLYLCTGDQALRERLRQRMHDVNLPSWPGRDADPATVRPFHVYGPDPRYFPQGDEAVWVPWEESLCVAGFAAYRELLDDRSPEIDALVDGLALNLLRYGWRVTSDGRAEVAYAMKLLPGNVPIPAERFDDRSVVNWPKSSFGVWAIGSLEVGRAAALRAGDTALVARADDLLARLRSRRAAPRDGFYDRFAQWDAVRLR